MVQQILTNAPNKDVQIGAFGSAITSGTESFVSNRMTGPAAMGMTVTVKPNQPAGAGCGELVTVTEFEPFDQVTWPSRPMNIGGYNA